MATIKKLIVLGAGGTARDVLSIIEDINLVEERYECIGLLDDNPNLWRSTIQGVEVIGPIREARATGEAALVNTLGSPRNYRARQEVSQALGVSRYNFESIVHPTAVVSRHAEIGMGSIIFPKVVLMANVRLGQQVLVLAHTVVNHDAVAGEFSILASGVNVSGAVQIGSNCYLGSGSCILENVVIGDQALVGMGSMVLRDVPARTVVAGNPAKVLRRQT
ncbi:MAG TPA: acetyltransferase [Pyrinomonadaceae bacterium]|nr:acetyltransferase [Pyrinomonadaceae bacterium]